MTCLKINLFFVFEFSLFHSELEYKVQSLLGYQGDTDQAHSWSVQSCCLFFPCCRSLFPNPFDLSLAGPCGLILLPTRACFSPWFLLESTDSTSFYNHKESGLIFFCVIRSVLLPVCFESSRRLVPRWILSKPRVASQRCSVCCWQGRHRGSFAPRLLPGDALIQQISNSTSDSGVVRAMPESSLLLNCSANKRLHQIVISQTRQLRKHFWVCNVWLLIRCRAWGKGSGKCIPTSFLHPKLSSVH